MISLHKTNTTYKKILKARYDDVPIGKGLHWRGVAHNKLIQHLHDEIAVRNWITGDERLAISPNGKNLAIGIEVSYRDIPTPEGHSFCLGVLNSNSRHHRFRVLCGTIVKETKVGIVWSTCPPRKHVGAFDLDNSLSEMLTMFERQCEKVCDKYERFQTSILPRVYYHLLFEAARRQFIPWSRLAVLDNFVQHHEELSAWNILHGFAIAIQKNPAFHQMQQVSKFRMLIEQVLDRKEKK